jgi:hypothetical protein
MFWNTTLFDVRKSSSILLVFEYLKMDATSSSERSVINYQSARRHIPDDCIILVYSCRSQDSTLARNFVLTGLCVAVVNGKVKVRCTLVQALRLCTGRTAHRGSRGIALLYRH